MYLSGFAEYDEADDDWAANNDFEPANKYFLLPDDWSKSGWQEVFDRAIDLVQTFTKKEIFANSFLAKAQAIAVGFDDGDLVLIE